MVEEFDVHQHRLRTIQRVHAAEVNVHGIVFGGHLMSLADELPSLLARRLTGKEVATATFGRVNFWAPLHDDQDLILESVVTGVAGWVVETFTIIWGENMYDQTRTLGFSCFSLYVVLDRGFTWQEEPVLKGTTALEKELLDGFADRQAVRLRWRNGK